MESHKTMSLKLLRVRLVILLRCLSWFYAFAFLMAIVVCNPAYGSCVEDNRTFTEMLFNGTGQSIFTCQILSSTVDKDADYYATARVIRAYIGSIDSSVVTIHSGDMNSSTGGMKLAVGAIYLIYSYGHSSYYSCCSFCDQWSKQISDTTNSNQELKLLDQFSKVIKRKRSGYYTFKNANGIVLAKGNYTKGKPSGLCYHYYDNGVIKAVYDLKHFVTSQYFENGRIKTKVTAQKNVSIYETYRSDTNAILKYKFIESKNDTGLVMQTFEYFDNGNLQKIEEQIVVNSNGGGSHGAGLTGIYEEYYNDGKLKVQGQYLNNKKIGVWKWFDVGGILITQITY